MKLDDDPEKSIDHFTKSIYVEQREKGFKIFSSLQVLSAAVTHAFFAIKYIFYTYIHFTLSLNG